MLELELCLTFEPRLIGYIIIIPTIVIQLRVVNKTVTIVIPLKKGVSAEKTYSFRVQIKGNHSLNSIIIGLVVKTSNKWTF